MTQTLVLYRDLNDVEADEARHLTRTRQELAHLLRDQALHLAKVERKAINQEFDPSQPFIGLLFGVPCGYFAYELWSSSDAWYSTPGAVILGSVAVAFLYVGITGFFSAPASKEKEPKGGTKAK